jgi:hypothetical protein
MTHRHPKLSLEPMASQDTRSNSRVSSASLSYARAGMILDALLPTPCASTSPPGKLINPMVPETRALDVVLHRSYE